MIIIKDASKRNRWLNEWKRKHKQKQKKPAYLERYMLPYFHTHTFIHTLLPKQVSPYPLLLNMGYSYMRFNALMLSWLHALEMIPLPPTHNMNPLTVNLQLPQRVKIATPFGLNLFVCWSSSISFCLLNLISLLFWNNHPTSSCYWRLSSPSRSYSLLFLSPLLFSLISKNCLPIVCVYSPETHFLNTKPFHFSSLHLTWLNFSCLFPSLVLKSRADFLWIQKRIPICYTYIILDWRSDFAKQQILLYIYY